MALDPTARESNVRDSWRKFLVDNLHTTEGIHLSFDRFVDASEIVKTAPPTVNRWISIVFGQMNRDVMGQVNIDHYCCTRQDPEGFRLAQLCDTLIGYLTDPDQTDTMKRVTFYRSREQGAWTSIGALLVHDNLESGEIVAPDQSKYKIVTTIVRWSAKV